VVERAGLSVALVAGIGFSLVRIAQGASEAQRSVRSTGRNAGD
jgi:hypothetical protein